MAKNNKTLRWLIKHQLGDGVLRHSTIINLANFELSEIEKDVLCRGLDFGVPPHLSPEMIASEFELYWQQLDRTPAVSNERREECKAALAHLSQQYANSRADTLNYPFGKKHFEVIKNLKRNKDIVITRPDKGKGVVVLKRSDYVEKMMSVLSQKDKFEKLGDVETCDRTLQQERALQAFLLKAYKKKDLSKEVYDRIRPVGSCRPRMYGLPKLHKVGIPIRPILSMVNAPQHQMAKWLVEILLPVVAKFGERTIKAIFEFCEDIEQFSSENDIERTFTCSFDIVSLFTNVPLQETINIVLDALYRDPDIPTPSQPEDLIRLMLVKATSDVEFSFNGVMYRQVDGIAMGSPLGPILANIFVGFQEARIAEEDWPLLYRRFVDDAFSVFPCDDLAKNFFETLNALHPALCFTMETEDESRLPFMDVLVQRRNGNLVRSVFRKPTFTGLYTRWDSFSPTHQKIALIRSLVSRAQKICSESMLQEELDTLRNLFLENGYPVDVVERFLRIERKPRAQTMTDDGKTACVRLPWIGQKSRRFRAEIFESTAKAYPRVKAVVIFTTVKAFSGRVKDDLPTTSQSSVIYEYTCRCNRAYVGKTTQHLGERIKQHIPDRLFVNLRGKPAVATAGDSAITRHLRESEDCLHLDRRNSFKIIAKARHSQHLDVLEALYIRNRSPELCQQKSFVHHLKLF